MSVLLKEEYAVSNMQRWQRTVLQAPLLWGAVATVGFFSLLSGGVVASLCGPDIAAFLERYCAGHPIEYVEVAFFFVGMAALFIRRANISQQRQQLKDAPLGPVPAGGQTASDCAEMLHKLDRLPEDRQETYLVRRLREGLQVVQRQGSADALDDELKYQSELDEVRAHGGLALVRVITWAIPILGFLGTVIGITMAIALLNPESLEQSLNYVVAALAVAFDTTAIALGFSMALMFTQFTVEKAEGRLLAAVDERARNELTARFRLQRDSGDPQAAAVRRMSETVIEATEKLVGRQAELWQGTVEAAHEKWSQAFTSTHSALETSLEHALSTALHKHAQQVAESGKALAEENHAHWSRVQQALHQNLQSIGAQQQEMTKLAVALKEAAGATSQVAKLETALNRNLEALSGAHHFEETLESLAGVIHLLNARVAHAPKPAEQHTIGRAA